MRCLHRLLSYKRIWDKRRLDRWTKRYRSVCDRLDYTFDKMGRSEEALQWLDDKTASLFKCSPREASIFDPPGIYDDPKGTEDSGTV